MAKEEEVNSLITKLDSGGWSFNQDRELVENVFVGRFNFFILIFSLFLTAGFANNFSTLRWSVFFAGALVLILMWMVLYRGYRKHDRMLRIIYNNMENHPTTVVERILQLEGDKPRYPVNKMMGVYIPLVCASILFGSGILAAVGCLR